MTGYVAKNASHAIVAVKGTNTKSIESLINDIKFGFEDLDDSQFPGRGGAKVHDGFYDTWKNMRDPIVAAVNDALNGGANSILVVGHSLGAAAATIGAVHLQHYFSSRATVTARFFGCPRVGNPDFANYVDSTLGARAQHMVVADDIVPHLPPLLVMYRQSSNELWLPSVTDTVWRQCAGQENDHCSDQVSDKGDAKFGSAHSGPYAGVLMGCR